MCLEQGFYRVAIHPIHTETNKFVAQRRNDAEKGNKGLSQHLRVSARKIFTLHLSTQL